MTARRIVLLLLGLLCVPPGAAEAAGWAGIEPGVSTIENVRARYGAPTRQTSAKVEGYDTTQWIYEGRQVPAGLQRMTVDFGLLTPSGYKPSMVRLLMLEPKPHIFGRNTVIEGWGLPDGATDQGGVTTFYYRAGLFVVFDKEGVSATSMIFGLPQPDLPEQSAPAAPPKR